MPITLTCTCGKQQSLASATPGQTVTCANCGKTLTVPAMGLPATAKPKPRPPVKRAERSSSQFIAVVVIALTGVLLIGGGSGWLIWSMMQSRPDAGQPIAEHKTSPPADRKSSIEEKSLKSSQDRKAEPSAGVDRNKLDSKKKSEQVGDPAPNQKKAPPKTVVEPTEKKEPLKSVSDPVVPKENPMTSKHVGDVPIPPIAQMQAKRQDPKPKVIEKKPLVADPIQLAWKLQQNDVFFQELVVTQKPNFKVQGIPIALGLQYRIVSRFTVQLRNPDGSLVVQQKIESAKLLQADDLTRQAIAAAVTQLPGTTYTLTLSPKMDVTKFEGAGAAPKIGNINLAGGMGMQMTSLLDRDGWKELAQATFFQMSDPLKVGARWSKPMTHNWGSLGSWTGQIHYLYGGQQGNFHKVGFGLQLAYKAPAGANLGGLKINGANFQVQQAEGSLLFDAVKGKVVAAEERFRVRGVINANVLGMNTPIEIDEDQHFAIRIHDKMP